MAHWFLAQLNPQAPGLWLALALAAWLAALLWRPRSAGRSHRWAQAARWVLPPYAGLLLGGLSPYFMGLANLDWTVSLGLGLGLILAVSAAAFFVRIAVAPADSLTASSLPAAQAPALLTFLLLGAEQFYWAFLRGALWELLRSLPAGPTLPAYWAVWLATAIALTDVATQPLPPEERLVKTLGLAATTVLFFYTRNFWLCWLLYAAVWFIFTSRRTASAPTERPS